MYALTVYAFSELVAACTASQLQLIWENRKLKLLAWWDEGFHTETRTPETFHPTLT